MKLGTLLLLPLYWQKLTPEDYGIIGLTQVVSMVLLSVLGFGGPDVIQRFYYEWSESDRPKHLGSIWVFSTLASLAVCVALDLSGDFIFSHFYSKISFHPYVRIFLWTLFFSNFSNFTISYFRITENLKKYNLVSIGTFITQAAFVLTLIYKFDMGVLGFFLGGFYSSILWALFHIFYFATKSDLNFKLKYLLGPLSYSFFTILSGLFDGSSFIFDRFFLDKNIALAAIGIYALANQIGGGYNVFNFIFKSAWFPFMYRVVSERKDGANIVGLFSTYSLAILAVPAIAVSLLIKELLLIIDNPSYLAVATYVPLFVLGYYCQSVGTAMGRGLDLSKSNQTAPMVPILTFFASYLFNSTLIPRYGVWGAAVAFVLVMAFRSLVQIYLSNRVYPRPFFWSKNIGIILVSVISYFLGSYIATDVLIYSIMLKILLLIVTSLLLVRVAAGKQIFSQMLAKLPYGPKNA
jgi:O-antigen/teichoic acid export membrane protein